MGPAYRIRPISQDEVPLLDHFLYEAIFIPEGAAPPPESIIQAPELQVYVEDFGLRPDDRCLVAEEDGAVVGAVWSRIMPDYGHVDDSTPSLAMSVEKDRRGRGIGTDLLRSMLGLLGRDGYGRVSLSVQKQNYALRMYTKAGFRSIRETGEEYIMVRDLENT